MLARLGALVVVGAIATLGSGCGSAVGDGGSAGQSTASSPPTNTQGSAFAAQMATSYDLGGVRAVVLDGNPLLGTDKPWLYATVSTDGAGGLAGEWQAILLASAYRANSKASDAPAIAGFSIVPSGDASCTSPAGESCGPRATISLEHKIARDPAGWSTDQAALRTSISGHVDGMDGAKLVGISFGKGVYAPLPEITIQAADPVAFAREYRYGSLAVLGDDADYEGYLVTVLDSNGDPFSVQAESYALGIGVGWSREDVRSAVQGGD